MSSSVRSTVTFKSTTFNTSELNHPCLNMNCFGDDLCRWLLQRLREQGVVTAAEPEHAGFWYLTFWAGNMEYHFDVAYRLGEDDGQGDWVGDIERPVGFISSLFRNPKRAIRPEAAQIIHAALSSSVRISDILWHFPRDFAAGRENCGTSEP